MRVLAELGKPAVGDTWMEQPADEQMSTSNAPQNMMNQHGTSGEGQSSCALRDLEQSVAVSSPMAGATRRRFGDPMCMRP